jgi:hypothetical protein
LRWGTLHDDGSFGLETHHPVVVAKDVPGDLEHQVKVYVPKSMPLSKLRAIAADAIELKKDDAKKVPGLAFVSPSGENLDDEARFPEETKVSEIPYEVCSACMCCVTACHQLPGTVDEWLGIALWVSGFCMLRHDASMHAYC